MGKRSFRQAVAGRYSLQDFARIRWLDGSWRGRLPGGGYFYERYRLVDDYPMERVRR